MPAGLGKDESMYSLDWTTGSGRFEFVTSGLSEEHLGLVSYDVEVAQEIRLLYDANSQGELPLPAQPAACRSATEHDDTAAW